MEPGSAVAACLFSVTPVIYYRGRSAIEAKSLGLSIAAAGRFRCNLSRSKTARC